ncbi:hypothetical protein C6P46_004200 [Rhodotorula mucilaginosa]|uniref:Uncharacterized protein n=1 Tax=Rhodotorula mucilaginosa TaxID=5537 RepID=A0A9P6W1A3_RHOMI|nr:hypothetical protein C6P46_004200 [Rhodotorula mucilaginosa]
MFSWAIPRGFDPPYDGTRLGIETFPHGKSYALYEGLATHGSSHAGIWDVGEYEIDSYERLGDLDNEETVSTHGDETAQAHDAEQEAKLREDDNQPTRGNPSRSFKILLKGTRFQNLRLEFSRRITDVKHVRPKDTRLPTTNRQWTIVVLGPQKRIAAAAATATTSILTGRTMDEINKQSRAVLLTSPNMVEENERMWSAETGESLSYPQAEDSKAKKEEEALECEEASMMLQADEQDIASACT